MGTKNLSHSCQARIPRGGGEGVRWDSTLVIGSQSFVAQPQVFVCLFVLLHVLHLFACFCIGLYWLLVCF